MFGFLFKGFSRYEKKTQLISENLYAEALSHSRIEPLYTRYGVPDTFDGRFESLLLHIYLVYHKIRAHEKYEELSQCIFDLVFKDMQLTLREIGIGDVGIPKHMKKMMKAFNGRMHAYKNAIEDNPDQENILYETLSRNLYGTVLEDTKESMIRDMEFYVLLCVELLYELDTEKVAMGNIMFMDPKNIPMEEYKKIDEYKKNFEELKLQNERTLRAKQS